MGKYTAVISVTMASVTYHTFVTRQVLLSFVLRPGGSPASLTHFSAFDVDARRQISHQLRANSSIHCYSNCLFYTRESINILDEPTVSHSSLLRDIL